MSAALPPARSRAGQPGRGHEPAAAAPLRPQSDQAPESAEALPAFFQLARLWQLTAAQQMTLLGITARSTFFQWKKAGRARLPRDTAERIGYLRGIHNALQMLVPDGALLLGWLRQPLDAPVTCGGSLLRRMLSGRVADLYEVHRYLAAAARRTTGAGEGPTLPARGNRLPDPARTTGK